MNANGWWFLLLCGSVIATGLLSYRQGWCDGQRDIIRKLGFLRRTR